MYWLVSILVLMDFRLKGHGQEGIRLCPYPRFNPCSNGLSAQRGCDGTGATLVNIVSILVLMDFRLKGECPGFFYPPRFRFNPCSNGLSAQRWLTREAYETTDTFQSLF